VEGLGVDEKIIFIWV